MRGDFVSLLKATRIERALFPLSFVMIAVAFADKVTADIFVFGLCCVLMFMSGGILNAMIDNDYNIRSFLIVPAIIIVAIIISLANKIIFFSVISWIVFSFLYNKCSRRILFGDSFFLSITHATISIFSAAILLDLSLDFAVSLGLFAFSSLFLFVPMKNLKGVKEDLEKKYRTLMTTSRAGKVLTYILFNFWMIVMFLSYFAFDLGARFLIVFSVILALKIPIDYYIYNGKQVLAYKIGRLVLLTFSFAFVFDKATNVNIVLTSGTLILLYLIYLTGDIISEIKGGGQIF